MKRYLKLVNFEFNRIAKVYAVMLGIILVSQIVAVITTAKRYMGEAEEAINEQMMSHSAFLEMHGPLEFAQVMRSAWFFVPIVFCIALVAFYIFLIWYRDWVGKNTFAYRLLTLPTTRLNLFYAKLTTILIMTFGFVAFQYIIYPVEKTIMQWMVPIDFRVDASFQNVIVGMFDMSFLFPTDPIDFVLRYGMGMIIVAVLFTGILFERSFRWKGIVLAIPYGIVAGVLMLLPLILNQIVLDDYFYTSEILLLTILSNLIVLAGSVVMSGYLLNKKIRI